MSTRKNTFPEKTNKNHTNNLEKTTQMQKEKCWVLLTSKKEKGIIKLYDMNRNKEESCLISAEKSCFSIRIGHEKGAAWKDFIHLIFQKQTGFRDL